MWNDNNFSFEGGNFLASQDRFPTQLPLVGVAGSGIQSYILSKNGSNTEMHDPTGMLLYGGASGEGGISGNASFNTFINALPAGARLFIKNGSYNMTGQILFKDGQNIEGETRTGVQIIGFKTSTVYALMVGNNVSGLTLKNLTFDVNNQNTAATQTPNVGLGIVLTGHHNTAENLVVFNSYLQGIVMGLPNTTVPSEGNLVVNCEVYQSGNDGIILAQCIDSHIRECYIHDTYSGTSGVAGGVNICYGSQRCTCERTRTYNTVYGFGTDHNINGEEKTLKFTGCTSEKALVNGFMFDGGDDIQVSECTAANYGQYGFTTFDNGHQAPKVYSPHNVVFTACNAKGDGTVHTSNSPTGFFLGGGSNITLTGCHSNGNMVGCWFTVMNGLLTIKGNTFGDNKQDHIMGTSSPQRVVMVGNSYDASCIPLYVDAATAPYAERLD